MSGNITLASHLFDLKQREEADIRMAVSLGRNKAILVEGDSREMMDHIDAESASLVFTSPPYCIAKQREYGDGQSTDYSPDKYVQWAMTFVPHIERVLSPRGVFALNIDAGSMRGEQMTQDMELVISIVRGSGLFLLQKFVWAKRNYMPGYWPNHFAKSHELVYVFAKRGLKGDLLRRDRMMVYQGAWSGKRLIGKSNSGDLKRNVSATGSGGGRRVANWFTSDPKCPTKEVAYPSSVLRLPTSCSDKGHSASFPIALPSWFVRAYTDPGSLVVDCFVGGGTTCSAASMLGRRSVGIDLSPTKAFKDERAFLASDKAAAAHRASRMTDMRTELAMVKRMHAETGLYPSIKDYEIDEQAISAMANAREQDPIRGCIMAACSDT